MSEATVKNAVIGSARITTADHDMLTVWLGLDYGGSGQGFGGYALMLSPDAKYRRDCEIGPNYAGVFIDSVMRIAGVQSWDQIPGKTIRVRSSHSCVEAIGHIVKEDWFEPKAAFEALKLAAARDTSND